MSDSRSPAGPPLAYVFAAVTTAGLVVSVAGTFLPWLRSGTVQRDSYQVAGAVDHFELLDNPFATAALKAWIGLPMVAAACVLLFAFRLLRTGALLASVVALVVGTVSVLAAVQADGRDGVIGVTATGPVTTITGMSIALCGALGVLATAHRRGATMGRAGVQP